MANDGYDSPDHDSSDGEAPPPEYYAAKGEQTDAENSLPMVLSVWWSFTWRFIIIFVAASFVIGLVMALVTGGDIARAEQIAGIASTVLALPISIWSLGKALSVKHKNHRIVFVRSSD